MNMTDTSLDYTQMVGELQGNRSSEKEKIIKQIIDGFGGLEWVKEIQKIIRRTVKKKVKVLKELTQKQRGESY